VKILILIILKAYRNFISPLFPPRCRFYPSCSQYCIEAIEVYGIVKGFNFAVRRLLKCHPFNPGGYDPLPKSKQDKRKN